MKHIFTLLLIAVLLSACGAKPTVAISDAEMQTKVAEILTAMPSATSNSAAGVRAGSSVPVVSTTVTSKP